MPSQPHSASGYRHADQLVQLSAPEQIERPLEVDHRADIYSLGVVLYELLTGELPLGRFDPPSQKATMDSRLDAIVLRALAKEPARRYQRINELRNAVESILQATPGAPVTGMTLPLAKTISAPSVPTSPLAGQPPIDLQVVRRQVRGPAVGLLITGLLGIMNLPAMWVASFSYEDIQARMRWKGVPDLELPLKVMMAVSCLNLPFAGIILVAARRMQNLRLYGLAVTASILAMLPCGPMVLVGLPLGLRAIVVLRRPHVKEGFKLKQSESAGHPPKMSSQ